MLLKDFLDKKIIVKQTRSSSKLGKKEKGCLVGLGLRKIGSTSELKCTSSVAGMIKKVEHVVEIKIA